MKTDLLRAFLLGGVLLLTCTAGNAQRRLNLFTECECNRTLLKQELNYVNHTIDPVTAQVNLFIVTNYLSNGGRVYVLQFKGQQELAGNDLSFKVSTTSVMTSLERDQYLNKRIELGLAGFLAGTDYADAIEITASTPEVEQTTQSGADAGAEPGEEEALDPWNAWIFEANANFSTQTETRRGNTSLRLGFEADRTTPELRIRVRPGYFYRTQTVTQSDGSELNSIRQDAWLSASVVRSISNHWSVGLFTGGSSSSFNNMDLGTSVMPAIEWNFFDYNQVPFKELTVAYRAGWVRNDYAEETIFFETLENLGRQSLDIDLRLRQRWGQVRAGISAASYLHDLSMNRYSFDTRANIRLFRGLSFSVGGSYEIINDQISLARGEATAEDLLLGQSQLATNFEADLRFGLSYTFGSLYNNVINTRL